MNITASEFVQRPFSDFIDHFKSHDEISIVFHNAVFFTLSKKKESDRVIASYSFSGFKRESKREIKRILSKGDIEIVSSGNRKEEERLYLIARK